MMSILDEIVDKFIETPQEAIKELIAAHPDDDDPICIGDLGDIISKFNIWKMKLARVEPFYAVKCNVEMQVLALLAHLGTGFDCSSKEEIRKVLSLNVHPSRIVYANPCKQKSHIEYAKSNNVNLTVFDNEEELHKLKAIHPHTDVLLRILPPPTKKVAIQLGNKFGCDVRDVRRLLVLAKELDINVVGVSFHVGNGCYDTDVYAAAVAASREVFDIGSKLGFSFNLLDIGGGFPGKTSSKISFTEICNSLSPALDQHFPAESGVRIIAEPGTYFVESAFTIASNVIGKRKTYRDEFVGSPSKPGPSTPIPSTPIPSTPSPITPENSAPRFMYYVNDGVYMSFICYLWIEVPDIPPTPLYPTADGAPKFNSSIWGPTCDSLDIVMPEVKLPELEIGSWLVFRDMGAYSISLATNFNNMPHPRVIYICKEEYRKQNFKKDSHYPSCNKIKNQLFDDEDVSN